MLVVLTSSSSLDLSTEAGVEVDLVIERVGDVIAIEIKAGNR
jgi:predicted RecB family endonuclease